MLTSITPLGERSRNRTWPTTALAYIVGSAVGGALAGTLAGGAGDLLPITLSANTTAWALAAVMAVVALDEFGLIGMTPIGRRQVNEDWLDEFRGWVVGLGFGLQLGLGVATIVTSLSVPATFLFAFVTQSWAWGLAIGATFGLARALPILQTRRVSTPTELATLHRRHDSAAGLARIGLAAIVVPIAIAVVVA